MHFRNSRHAYGIIAQAFHWLIALLIVIQLLIGVYAADLPVSIERLQWLSRHKALGITVLALVLLRLGWRLFNRPPPLPANMPRWEQRAAGVTHWLIYLVLIAAPLAGWLYASAAGLSVNWFGVLRVPDLVERNAGLAQIFKAAHFTLVATLALLLLLHVSAAVRHASRNDGIMQRMLPQRKKRHS